MLTFFSVANEINLLIRAYVTVGSDTTYIFCNKGGMLLLGVDLPGLTTQPRSARGLRYFSRSSAIRDGAGDEWSSGLGGKGGRAGKVRVTPKSFDGRRLDERKRSPAAFNSSRDFGEVLSRVRWVGAWGTSFVCSWRRRIASRMSLRVMPDVVPRKSRKRLSIDFTRMSGKF